MFHEASAMPTLWVVFLVLFLVGPAWRWGGRWRWGGNSRWAYRFGCWGGDDLPGRYPGRLDEAMAALEQRTQDVETLEARVTELENRLDFAERLLAERRHAEITGGVTRQ